MTVYQYSLNEITPIKQLRGLNRAIVLQLEASDQIFLQVESDGAVITGPTYPFRFIGYELVWNIH